MIVYDFEVFMFDWLVVFKNIATKQLDIVVNNPQHLKEFYEEHKNNIFVGYNNKAYDDIVLKGIISGVEPYTTSTTLMQIDNKYEAYKLLGIKNIPLISVDLMQDVLGMSLKQAEGYMGLDVDECTIPFNIERKLDEHELEEVIKYCCHDVNATEKLLEVRQGYVQSKLEIIKLFNLPITCLGSTNAQLCAQVLQAKRTEHDDELKYEMPDTIKIEKPEYREILSLYNVEQLDYTKTLNIDIAGVNHTLAYGGIHAARKNFYYTGEMWNIDVNSFYPSMMIRYNFLSRNCNGLDIFKQIYDDRITAKHAGDTGKANAYKLILNTTYGAMKSVYNALYDPKMANQVCITGQLLFVDLIEKLEPYMTLVQSNTDGILVIPKNKEKIKELLAEWEERTGMTTEIDICDAIYQKDVNNYIMVMKKGDKIKIKTKGAYVKQFESKDLRNTTRILDEAVVRYFLENKLPQDTINECDDLFMFQYITKTGHSYGNTVWEKEPNKLVAVNNVNRVYASKVDTHGNLLKIKEINGLTIRTDSIANLPVHCIVDNKNELSINDIDKNWYIDIAWKRINDFKGGV